MFAMNLTSVERSAPAFQRAIAATLAGQKFDRAYARSWLDRLWAFLTKRSARMLNLQRVKNAVSVENIHYEGLRPVPLDRIRGSENRHADFDVHFHPLRRTIKERWMHVAQAMLLGVELPPVELIRIGETYFVRDGHHRISAARALGQQDIDAVVTAWKVTDKPARPDSAARTCCPTPRSNPQNLCRPCIHCHAAFSTAK